MSEGKEAEDKEMQRRIKEARLQREQGGWGGEAKAIVEDVLMDDGPGTTSGQGLCGLDSQSIPIVGYRSISRSGV